jgi:hypothetical protein
MWLSAHEIAGTMFSFILIVFSVGCSISTPGAYDDAIMCPSRRRL